MLQEAGHIKNTVVLIFLHIQCSHLINSEVASVLVSLGTQVQPQIILDLDYLLDYLFISYDYGETNCSTPITGSSEKIENAAKSCKNTYCKTFSLQIFQKPFPKRNYLRIKPHNAFT